jgi:PTH2 family peptidyl-tRNA hydrolase
MRKGKIAAQVAHAAMKVFFDRMEISTIKDFRDEFLWDEAKIKPITTPMRIWMEGSFTKVVVGCKNKAELLELQRKAYNVKIPNALMVDNGWTEFHNTPTITCLAIGPDYVDLIDPITRDLPLI